MDCNLDHAEAKGRQSDHAGSKRRRARSSDKQSGFKFPEIFSCLYESKMDLCPVQTKLWPF